MSDHDQSPTQSQTRYVRIVRRLENNGPLVIVALSFLLIGALVDLRHYMTTLVDWANETHFSLTAPRPFPVELNARDLEQMTSGTLRLAELRIWSFLNGLEVEGSWLDRCLSNETAFTDAAKREAQVNRTYRLKPTTIDRRNLTSIKDRLNEIDESRDEAREFLAVYPLRDRVALRAKSQLLYDYRHSEIAQLSPGDLYVTRNEIYARHGLRFQTPKLSKYFRRKPWYEPRDDFRFSEISALEVCNAYLLRERGPRSMYGPFGRAVHLSMIDIPGLVDLPHALQNCFDKRGTGIEIYTASGSRRDLFETSVDLVLTVKRDSVTHIEATELDQRFFGSGNPSANAGRLRVALGRLASGLSGFLSTITEHGTTVEVRSRRGDYLGIDVGLADTDRDVLLVARKSREAFEDAICINAASFLEQYGDAIPDVVSVDPTEVPRMSSSTEPIMDTSTNGESWIVSAHVDYGRTRRQLSLSYLKERYGLSLREPVIEPKMIVIHWTAIDSLQASLNAFKAPRLPRHRVEISRGGEVNVGTHYLVARDGTVFRLIEDTLFARHTIGLNYNAISIENVGGNLDTPMTTAQLESNEKLVRYLVSKHRIEWLIGHHEYSKFRGTELWRESDPTYFTTKIDPGPTFMADLRERLADLSLLSQPVESN